MADTTINYFELYKIPVSFHPDATVVKSRFYELSRQYHPDRFAHTGSINEQAEALRIAAANNEAYKTFKNADATMAYILKLNGVLQEEEKYNLPPDFLMEMMDLNEAVSDYEMEEDNEGLKQQAHTALQSQLHTWQQEAGPLTEKFDQGDHSEALLLKIKDYYMRKKYLLRIQERIDRFAAR
jgi:molecular chaperone HscB